MSIARIACQFLNLAPSLLPFRFLRHRIGQRGRKKSERRLLWHPSLADPSTVKHCDSAGEVVVICDCVQSREREWLNKSWGLLKRRRAVPKMHQPFKLQHFCFSSKRRLFGYTPGCWSTALLWTALVWTALLRIALLWTALLRIPYC